MHFPITWVHSQFLEEFVLFNRFCVVCCRSFSVVCFSIYQFCLHPWYLWIWHNYFFPQSLVFYVGFMDHCLIFCPFSLGKCIVCPSIDGFILSLWYLQTFLAMYSIQMYTLEYFYVLIFIKNANFWTSGYHSFLIDCHDRWWFHVGLLVIKT